MEATLWRCEHCHYTNPVRNFPGYNNRHAPCDRCGELREPLSLGFPFVEDRKDERILNARSALRVQLQPEAAESRARQEAARDTWEVVDDVATHDHHKCGGEDVVDAEQQQALDQDTQRRRANAAMLCAFPNSRRAAHGVSDSSAAGKYRHYLDDADYEDDKMDYREAAGARSWYAGRSQPSFAGISFHCVSELLAATAPPAANTSAPATGHKPGVESFSPRYRCACGAVGLMRDRDCWMCGKKNRMYGAM